MKKMISLGLSMLLLSGCGQGQPADREEVIVFAASSLTEPLNKVEDQYEADHPEVDILYTFDSSGTLQRQIEAGAPCDVFLSAALKQMDELEVKGYIQSETRFDWLQNQVVLITPEGNPAFVDAFDDLLSDRIELLAIGNADVPAGQYAQEVLTSLGYWETLQAEQKLTFGSNVKEVAAQVKAGAVDCGIVYATDAYTADLPVIATAPEGSHTPVIYPAARMARSGAKDRAEDFLAYLRSEEVLKVFQTFGFSVPEN